MRVDFPFHFDDRGRTAGTTEDDHVRDLIEQVLFTAPGERVNRPSFGCGLLQLVFEPGGDVVAAATQLTVQGALQEWLGEVIQVEAVRVEAQDAALAVTVQYVVRHTGQRHVARFARGGR
jgi:phage baseplate assembly protein W